MHTEVDARNADQQHGHGGEHGHRPAPAPSPRRAHAPAQQHQHHRQRHRSHRMAAGETVGGLGPDRLPQVRPGTRERMLGRDVQQHRTDDRDAREQAFALAPVQHQCEQQRRVEGHNAPCVTDLRDQHERTVEPCSGHRVNGFQQWHVEEKSFAFVQRFDQFAESPQRRQHPGEHEQQAPSVDAKEGSAETRLLPDDPDGFSRRSWRVRTLVRLVRTSVRHRRR